LYVRSRVTLRNLNLIRRLVSPLLTFRKRGNRPEGVTLLQLHSTVGASWISSIAPYNVMAGRNFGGGCEQQPCTAAAIITFGRGVPEFGAASSKYGQKGRALVDFTSI
jgi:hypothetical protein